MSKLNALLAAGMLAAGIIAVYLWQQLHAERQLMAQLQERTTQLEVQLQGRPAIAALLQPPSAAATVAAPATSIAAASPTNRSAALAVAANDVARRMLGVFYPDIEKELNLSATEADALAQLLNRGASEAEIEALLGAKSAQWQEYKVSVEARRRTSELRSMLANGSHPLTDEQAQQLVPTIVAEQKRSQEEAKSRTRPSDPRGQLDFDEENLKSTEARYNRIVSATRAYLSPEQVTLMQSSMDRMLNNSRANLKVQRAQLEAGGNGTTALPANIVIAPTNGGTTLVIAPN